MAVRSTSRRIRRLLAGPRRRTSICRTICSFVLVLAIVLATAFATISTHAQLEMDTLLEEVTPTANDLFGITIDTDGEGVAVGDAATVISRSVDAMGTPTWTSRSAWASAFFSEEIFDVAPSPVALPAGKTWALSGRETVVETDFTNTLIVETRPGTDAVFTPVVPTENAIWYGVPDFGILPSFIHRYDRGTQMAPGVVTPSPVGDICRPDSGPVRFVTLDGDVFEIDDLLTISTLYDHPETMNLDYARFATDCLFVAGARKENFAQNLLFSIDFSAGVSVDTARGPTPPEPKVDERLDHDEGTPTTASCTKRSGGRRTCSRGSCDDPQLISRLQAIGYADATLGPPSLSREVDGSCAIADSVVGDLQPVIVPRIDPGADPDNAESLPQSLEPDVVDQSLLFTAGTDGRVHRAVLRHAFFYDGFETEDFSAWSLAVP